jgi:hypothetical protein
MMGLSVFAVVGKINTCQSISEMQALIHGWNTPTFITSDKTMAPLHNSFSFPKPRSK